MKFKIVTLLITLLATSYGFAETDKLKALDDELTFFEWNGPKAFVSRLNEEKVSACKFLIGAEKRHQKKSTAIRRVLLSLQYAECPGRKQTVEKYLISKDPLLREAAIRLASSLPFDQRKEVEPRIKQLKTTDKDPAVVFAIAEFFQNK